jgi:hypothetical protein
MLVLKVIEQAFQEKYELDSFKSPSSIKNCSNLEKRNFSANFETLTASFSPNFKFKFCLKFKISQTKITKYRAVNYVWLADFQFLTDF